MSDKTIGFTLSVIFIIIAALSAVFDEEPEPLFRALSLCLAIAGAAHLILRAMRCYKYLKRARHVRRARRK